jgi:hypothetical protein
MTRFSDGPGVGVVLDNDLAWVSSADPAGDVEAVPAGHDRRVHDAPGGEFERAGDADADSPDFLVSPQQLRERVFDEVRTGRGPSQTSTA